MRLLFVISLVGLLCRPTAGAVVLSDSFDSYADQAAFNAAWPVSGTASGTLVTSPNLSPPNAVTFATTAQRNARSFGNLATPAANNIIRFSFDFYDSDAAAGAYRQYGEIIDGAGTSSGQLIALGLNNNIVSSHYMARIVGVDGGSGASAFFKLDGAGTPTRSTGWHNLAVEITNTTFKFFVDSVLAKTVTNAVTLRQYDAVRLGSNLSATRSASFDNVLVTTAVPESGSLILVGLVAFSSLGIALGRKTLVRA